MYKAPSKQIKQVIFKRKNRRHQLCSYPLDQNWALSLSHEVLTERSNCEFKQNPWYHMYKWKSNILITVYFKNTHLKWYMRKNTDMAMKNYRWHLVWTDILPRLSILYIILHGWPKPHPRSKSFIDLWLIFSVLMIPQGRPS